MTARSHILLAGACLAAAIALPALAQPAIQAAIADKGRPEADTKRDADRKPAEIVAFAGVKPGMTVEELFPGGGYYTRILAKVVGPKGKLFLVTPDSFKTKQEAASAALAKEVGNATVVWEPGDSPLTPDHVDVVWSTDNYHDYRNPSFGGIDMAKFNKAVFDSLKPGGVYIIEDYEAATGAGAAQTGTNHRIESATVIDEVQKAGFKLEGKSDVLKNPNDDHTLKIFDPMIRGHADQYVLKFRKPK